MFKLEARKYYREHIEEKRAYGRARYHRSKSNPSYQAYRDQYAKDHREDAKQWRSEHRDEIVAYKKAHRDEINAKQRLWYHNNLSKQRAYSRMCWRTGDGLISSRAKRRALLKLGPPLTLELVQSVYEDNIKLYGTLTCWLCFKPVSFGEDNLDHDVPVIRGGLHVKSNLGVAHASCNLSKGRRTKSEYIGGVVC